MPFIAIVPPGKATGDTADVYKYAARVAGMDRTARIVQMFSLRAGSMRRMVRTWELMMWMGNEPRRNREMVAAAVSRFNNCPY